MPWKIAKRNDEYCVLKQSDDSVVKCFSAEKAAKDFMAALYANTSDAKKAANLVSLSERMDRVYAAVDRFNDPPETSSIPSSYTSVVEVYANTVILSENRQFFRAGYTIDSETNVVTIADRSTWTEVEKEWRAKALARLEIDYPESTPNALKAISSSDDELRVGNYIVLFGGRDLEGTLSRRRNGDGSRGEFFTKATTFESTYTDTGMLYVDWEHGQQNDGPRKEDVLGIVDWKSAQVDDTGIFVERVLNRRYKYVQILERLIRANLIGSSSQAVTSDVKVAPDGEIKAWPLMRDTLTVCPMDYRMLTDNTLQAAKALVEKLPELESLFSRDAVSDVETSRSKADNVSATDVAADKANREKQLQLELELIELA